MSFALYGKLPLASDFVTGGELGGFPVVREWLHAAFGLALRLMPEGWDSMYRTAPMWRFAATVGVLAPEAVVGILTPSIDRAGRLFPAVVVATALPSATHWYENVEQSLLDVFAGRVSTVEQVFERLQGDFAERSLRGEAGEDRFDLLLGAGGLRRRMSLWWCGQDAGRGSARVFESMPFGHEMMGLLQSFAVKSRAGASALPIRGGPVEPWRVVRRGEQGSIVVAVFAPRDEAIDALVETALHACPDSLRPSDDLAFVEVLDRDLSRLADDRAQAEHQPYAYHGMALLRVEPHGVSIHLSRGLDVRGPEDARAHRNGGEIGHLFVEQALAGASSSLRLLVTDGGPSVVPAEADWEGLELVGAGVRIGIGRGALLVWVTA